MANGMPYSGSDFGIDVGQLARTRAQRLVGDLADPDVVGRVLAALDQQLLHQRRRRQRARAIGFASVPIVRSRLMTAPA